MILPETRRLVTFGRNSRSVPWTLTSCLSRCSINGRCRASLSGANFWSTITRYTLGPGGCLTMFHRSAKRACFTKRVSNCTAALQPAASSPKTRYNDRTVYTRWTPSVQRVAPQAFAAEDARLHEAEPRPDDESIAPTRDGIFVVCKGCFA